MTNASSSSRRSTQVPSSRQYGKLDAFEWSFCGFLAVSLLIGGASQLTPINDMLVRLCAIPIALWAFFRLAERKQLLQHWPLWLLAGSIVVVVGWQLAPLPESWVMALPGRATFLQDLAGLGIESPTRAASLSPPQTLNALLGFLPWLAAGVGALTLGQNALRASIIVIVGVSVGSVALGAFQFATPGSLSFYNNRDVGLSVAYGLFANRNHWATSLAICIPLTVWLWHQRLLGSGKSGQLNAFIIVLVLTAGVGVSMSRAGLVLLALAGLVTLVVVYTSRRISVGPRLMMVGAVGAAAIIGLALASGRGAIARFGSLQDADMRLAIFKQTISIIPSFWPAGSGGDTFVQIYKAHETVDILDPNFTNRAHNEYLEIALEHGIGGLIVLAFAFILMLGAVIVRMKNRPRLGGSAMDSSWLLMIPVLVLGIHSLVDYPLRTPAMMVVFSMLYALVVAGGPKDVHLGHVGQLKGRPSQP